ncbi:hypothetical protein [Paraburkholderia youngii]|uniref:hypothetical protein n=1 Tax=Paraburkholderia youngii TaxID=2782701 RepID=UPI003D24CEFA
MTQKTWWTRLAGFLRSGGAVRGSDPGPAGREAGAPARKTIPIAVDATQDAKGFTCPPSCWGTCCDDTVFLEPRDVAAIHQFADRHYARFVEHFANRYVLFALSADGPVFMPAYVTNRGVSRFQFFRNAVESELLGPPPHNERHSNITRQPYYHTLVQFNRTTGQFAGCVFLTDRRTCFLEEVAVEAGEHRWTAKPEGCVLFPLVAMPSGMLKPLASPENAVAGSLNDKLLKKFQERACCTQVTPQNGVHQMSEAVDFVQQAKEARTHALEHLQKTRMVELRSGFLQIFDRPVAGTASPRRR